MNALQIPKDLRAFAIKTALKRIIPCALLFIGFAVVLIFWGDVILPIDKDVVKVIVYTMVMLVPFALTGVPFKLIDKTYSGTVQKVEITTTADNAYHGQPTRENLYPKNTVFLHVVQENGVVIRKKAYERNAKLPQNLDAYKVGDSVFHLYGSMQTIVLPRASDEFVQCSVCGIKNDKNENVCESCGHSLIKNMD
ncbi:MAG: zinc ribbon domain-containing protein [Ruminococcaceae bacterium]|nr:zinc ribbon domain-containing protein [Oscillospiraceae bacterium]